MDAVSADGTTIHTEDTGSGPPLVLVPGSTFDAVSMAGLTAAISDTMTCFAMDRRGRGASGDSSSYSIEREYEDVAAVVNAVGSSVTLFGHSYGALCCLGAMEKGIEVDTLVLYEPPIPIGGPPDPKILARARSFLERGQARRALEVLLLEIVQVPAGEFTLVQALPDAWFDMFAPTALREMSSVVDGDVARFSDIPCRVLLLLGSESPANIVDATRALAESLPNARIATLEGQGHNAILAAPQLIAEEIRSLRD